MASNAERDRAQVLGGYNIVQIENRTLRGVARMIEVEIEKHGAYAERIVHYQDYILHEYAKKVLGELLEKVSAEIAVMSDDS